MVGTSGLYVTESASFSSLNFWCSILFLGYFLLIIYIIKLASKVPIMRITPIVVAAVIVFLSLVDAVEVVEPVVLSITKAEIESS